MLERQRLANLTRQARKLNATTDSGPRRPNRGIEEPAEKVQKESYMNYLIPVDQVAKTGNLVFQRVVNTLSVYNYNF